MYSMLYQQYLLERQAEGKPVEAEREVRICHSGMFESWAELRVVLSRSVFEFSGRRDNTMIAC